MVGRISNAWATRRENAQVSTADASRIRIRAKSTHAKVSSATMSHLDAADIAISRLALSIEERTATSYWSFEMTINIATETIISLTAAAKRLPRLRNDRPVSATTIWRWYRAGIRGVNLETIIIGGTRATSVEALDRFLAEINGQPVQLGTRDMRTPQSEHAVKTPQSELLQ